MEQFAGNVIDYFEDTYIGRIRPGANVGAYHPNFGKFIDILKREQSLNHVNIFHKLELAINQSLNVVAIKTATDE